jgi:phage terminase large subunit
MPQLQLTPEDAEYIIDTYLPPEGSGRKPIPHLFVQDVLGCKTWHMQDEITCSVFENKITAVKTCNAVGKSFIAARIVVAFLTLHPASIVVTTAPTWRQVTDILWRELATAVKKSKYKLTDNEVRQAGLDIDKDWYAVGLSTKYPENFFGYHANHILVVVDEAGGVPEPVFKGVKAITPNANARILYIGNPTDPSGTFFEVFDNPKMPAKRFTISAFDSPNFIACGIRNVEQLIDAYSAPPDYDPNDWAAMVDKELAKRMDPHFESLISPGKVWERYLEWGTDHPNWQALVLGEFPSQANQALIPMSLVMQAMDFGKAKDPIECAEQTGWSIRTGVHRYGHDSARFGEDLHVLTPTDGGWVNPQVTWSKVDGPTAADNILKNIDPYDPQCEIQIDDTGNGGSTTDHLNYLIRESFKTNRPYQYHVSPYVFGSKQQMSEDDQKQFFDITSKVYWELRMKFMRREIGFTQYDQELFYELTGRTWSTVGGKIKVEDKESFKKRTGRKSPDRSDSLALAMAPRSSGTWTQTEFEKGMSAAAQLQQAHRLSTSNGTVIGAPANAPAARSSDSRPITSGLDVRY